MAALESLRQQEKNIPFILVTGSLGEEAAVECIKKGASDYILKDRVARIPVAVRRALEEKTLREEHERLKLQLSQSQKMEAIGRLAGGIAHDFNNHLGIMIGYSERLLDRLGPDDPLRKSAGMIKDAGLRAATLTRQLLAFSRRQVFEPRILDANAVIVELEKMLRPLIGEDIELILSLNAATGRVQADPAQIDQVIMNLVINSRDAMPQGGRLTIETTDVELDEEYASKHATVRPGSYVMVAVSDNGMGMDNETQTHMFEPFFTTKEKGKGTGLGLATVYGIVKQSGGYIWVYSEPGKGTTFKIYLPRAEAGIQQADAERVSSAILKGEETVLVVEDEGMLLELACEFLQSSGYAVLEAGNGSKAVEISRGHRGPIHLLMTDAVMPGMSGRELAQRLHDDRPDIKVLYVSGYTDDSVLRNGLLEPGTAFLQKPFTRDSLARKVREVLDRGSETLGQELSDRTG
jgi:signal transduction histidine kinase